MFLSLLTPRPGHEREAAQQRLADGPYGDHQWLWRLFPAEAGTARDFLFRRQEVGGLPRYHLVSQRAPQSPGEAWLLQTRPYAPKLEAGERLAFELLACPTVRHGRDPRDGKSRRHDVVMEAKKTLLAERSLSRWADWPASDGRPDLYALVQSTCTAWLARRGERAGFVLDEACCVVSAYQPMRQRRSSAPADEAPLQFSTVELSGELTVQDPSAFTHMLTHGLGSAKAFGCGLMLVRRAL
ncbi:type I-E CRISPR-associated protein Cas6/Cse3/CasE [Vitreoscilla filiformis]|uniref:Type I-E CRISPR-associated protein Cas6/Cse3/CasE n=1 Tax=Vitreoscilla filiformis TaxID=63 RepID=A0A221KAY9_VITFI|nr:type I-E CRISPR-associated protein Cas6/Cse3/CasE [Vitreoscilla filiformis]ASM76182.1 type I-E CRISPR-associated protein Cas6/Cse3/CasE [Vitreoscilla filiformis]